MCLAPWSTYLTSRCRGAGWILPSGLPGTHALASAVRAAVRAVDPEQPVNDIATMETLVYRQATGITYVAVLMGVFGLIALVLSSSGSMA